jgi:hypothetical protein
MPFTLAPWFVQQLFDDNGDPLAGGKVYSYASGTATPIFTYADSLGTLNTNPVILSSSGRMRMYLDALAYKMIVTDANDVPVGLTMDPVTSTALGTAGAGIGSEIYDFGGDSTSPITALAYPAGALFSALHAGTSVLSVDSANLVGSFAIQATGLMTVGGTLTVAIVNLSDGAPNVPLADLTITSLTGAVATSAVITFAAPGATKQYGIKAFVSANAGFAWGVKLLRVA